MATLIFATQEADVWVRHLRQSSQHELVLVQQASPVIAQSIRASGVPDHEPCLMVLSSAAAAVDSLSLSFLVAYGLL